MSVEEGSIAAELGIASGDSVALVNGLPLRDVIDYRFYTAESSVEIEIENTRGEKVLYEIEKDPDEPLGIQFGEEVFDGIRKCGNKCPFCFVDGLPGGMRDSLYLKDDDYRLSFLHGNFITLTNMSEADFDRIVRQHLSPLYVSVHSFDPQVREHLLGSTGARRIREQLERLTASGITIHAQVVVCPGINDGRILDDTVRELSTFWPLVASVGVVPVGLTRFQKCPASIRAATPGDLEAIAAWWEPAYARFKESFGYGFVFLADEIFIATGREFPPLKAYEDLPQYENGIGIAPSFLDDLLGLRLAGRPRAAFRGCVVCGTLPQDLLRKAARLFETIEGLTLEVLPVENRFFGGGVGVSGLLTGEDIINTLRGRGPWDAVFVPRVALRDGAFLDSVTISDVSKTLGTRIVPAGPGPASLAEMILRPETGCEA